MSSITRYVVIENTPGYMPDDDDPFETYDYDEAVRYLNERAAEYADDADASYRVEYGIASSANLAAVMVYDDDKSHDLGRYIGVEIVEDEPEYFTVDGHPGIGWHVLGYAKTWTDGEWTYVGCPDGDRDDEANYVYDEGDWYEDRSRVVAVMVGDDAHWTFDIGDITPHYDEPLCGCGQIGCGWHGEEGSAVVPLIVGVALVLVLAVLAIYAVGRAADHESRTFETIVQNGQTMQCERITDIVGRTFLDSCEPILVP